MTRANENGKPKNKMAAVRLILKANPDAKPSDISSAMKTEYGMTISPKMAGTYRYHILGRKRRAKLKAARAAAGERQTVGISGDALDELIRAAEQLGWRRVKQIADSVLKAPV